MTTETDLLDMNSNLLTKIAIVMVGLIAGLIGLSILVLGGLMLLTGTPLPASLTTVLGITAKTPWHISRSAGTVAYLLLAGSTIWGLLLSTKMVKEAIPAALSLAMHNILSWLALAFTGLHAVMLLFDNFYAYTLADLTVPFIGPYRPGWVGLGIIGFYLMLLVVLSFQFRNQLGHKRWRALHYLSFVVFVMATIHGLMAGTDSGNLGMRIMYLGSGLAVFFVTNYRLLTRQTKRVRHPQTTS